MRCDRRMLGAVCLILFGLGDGDGEKERGGDGWSGDEAVVGGVSGLSDGFWDENKCVECGSG